MCQGDAQAGGIQLVQMDPQGNQIKFHVMPGANQAQLEHFFASVQGMFGNAKALEVSMSC